MTDNKNLTVNEEMNELELDEISGGTGKASAYAGVQMVATAKAGAYANASARAGVTVYRPRIVIFAGVIR